MQSFCACSTRLLYQARSFVTEVIFVSPLLVLSKHWRIEAEQIVAREIRRFAVANGASNRYHDTLTRFWVHLAGHAMGIVPEAESIDELLARFPLLLDKSLPHRHWRGETFNSDEARARWVEPDLVLVP